MKSFRPSPVTLPLPVELGLSVLLGDDPSNVRRMSPVKVPDSPDNTKDLLLIDNLEMRVARDVLKGGVNKLRFRNTPFDVDVFVRCSVVKWPRATQSTDVANLFEVLST
jgi:hypothetical protein